jgi:hypothetical protein
MEVIWEICLQAVGIFTLVAGFLGIVMSLLLLFAPRFFKSLSEKLNRYVDVDTAIKDLADKEIRTERLIYEHNIIAGAGFIIGSAIILVFLFYRLDVKSLAKLGSGYNNYPNTSEIIIGAMVLIGKIAGVLGIIIGSILLFSSEQLRVIEGRLNIWFSTQPVVDKLDRSYKDIDTLVFKRPVIFGIIGLIPSLILTYLAIRNLLV